MKYALVKDAEVFRQITLRQSRHHATGTGVGDLQPNLSAYSNDLPNPIVFDESLLSGSIDHDIWSKAPYLEPTLRVERTQSIDRPSGQNVQGGIVEERSDGRIPCNGFLAHLVGFSLIFRPVLFEARSLRGEAP
jgi:hypothetical protein